jgi:two-component system, sensor histidine kinase
VHSIKNRWNDLSITKKLFAVFGVMAFLIGFELLILSFAMGTMSSVRAFIEGEALWSKAQKDAVHSLQSYLATENFQYYENYKKNLAVPLGDRAAREEIQKAQPRQNVIREGFLQGGLHPDDIEGMVRLLTRFQNVHYIHEAIIHWSAADLILDELMHLADEINMKIQLKKTLTNDEYQFYSDQLDDINYRATVVESKFSATLAAGSRWLENALFLTLLCIVLTVEATGFFFTFSFSRNLSKGLQDLTDAAGDIGRGQFDKKVKVRSKDELGRLARSINKMGDELKSNVGRRLEAENLNQIKSSFLANMSHEIRTPLGLIIGFAALLENENLDSEKRNKYLEIIKKSGENLTDIINDILDISKVESGHLTIKKEDVFLLEILTDLKKLLQLRADEKGLDLQFNFETDIPRHIHTDPVRLRQVLLNVLGNAIKFTDSGRVALNVSIAHDLLIFDVFDSGHGIPQDDFDLIFEAFRQSDNSYTRKQGGTGLGLPLSKHLAHILGGDLVLKKSQPKVGSHFQLTVKYEPALKVPMTSDATITKDKKGEELNLFGRKILIVDDSHENRILIEAILKKWGCSIEMAENGKESLQKIKECSYDLVLMDLQMPVMSGIDATLAIRRKGYTMPIVALTAHAMKEVSEQCESSGFSGFISKPIRMDKLVQTVASLLRA